MRAREALANSENVPAVWLLARTGVPPLLSLLRRAGLTTLGKNSAYYGYALTMGDAEVRLSELVAAYSALARGGTFRTPRAMLRATDTAGRDLPLETPPEVRLVSQRAAFWVTSVLSDPDARAPSFGRGGALDFPCPAAVKTGTSQAYRDNWTIAYTKEVTVGVWVGNFDRTPLANSSGVTGAGPILHDVLLAAQKRVAGSLAETSPLASPTDDLVETDICALSGLQAGATCPRAIHEWLPSTSSPGTCDWHRGSSLAWPAAFRGWAVESGLISAQARARPASLPSRKATFFSSRKALVILEPPDGSTYLIDPTLRREYQALSLRANPSAGVRNVTWTVDGEPLGTESSDVPWSWPLVPGEHTIAARDGDGHEDVSKIFVR
jgi:penicillin-binding protein 1C